MERARGRDWEREERDRERTRRGEDNGGQVHRFNVNIGGAPKSRLSLSIFCCPGIHL